MTPRLPEARVCYGVYLCALGVARVTSVARDWILLDEVKGVLCFVNIGSQGNEHMNTRLKFYDLVASVLVATGLSGCSTPTKMSPAELESIGVHNGARYWEAQQKLFQQGYSCYVSGAMRENFDCTRTAGAFPTCLLHITYLVDDKNLVSMLTVKDPACKGTP